jgi:hypothetical protein
MLRHFAPFSCRQMIASMVRRTALLDQRCQLSPLRICQNAITGFICYDPNIGTDIKG